MRAIKVAGHKVPCTICRKRPAKAPFAGQIFCGRCMRPFLLGFMAGSMSHSTDRREEK